MPIIRIFSSARNYHYSMQSDFSPQHAMQRKGVEGACLKTNDLAFSTLVKTGKGYTNSSFNGDKYLAAHRPCSLSQTPSTECTVLKVSLKLSKMLICFAWGFFPTLEANFRMRDIFMKWWLTPLVLVQWWTVLAKTERKHKQEHKTGMPIDWTIRASSEIFFRRYRFNVISRIVSDR